MKMIDYRKIWRSINDESQRGTAKTQIARRISPKSIIPVFLATDVKRGIRLLYICLEQSHDIVTEDLPRFRGLEISFITTSIGQFKNAGFLKFTQSIPDSDNIFELVISDICDKIINIQNNQNLNIVLNKVLNEWKIFFDKQENEILSVAAQTGLVGELIFLKDYLFQKYSSSESLIYWSGSDKTNHDFQIKSNAVEIKTTTSKHHKKIIVSSERQMDNTGLDHLFLAVFSLNLHNNMPDKTLSSYIKEIYSLIQDDPVSTFQFQIKISKYGYNELSEQKYNIGFSLSEVKFFEIRDGFPRLLQNNLPDGVGDLKYSVVIAACTPFEITSTILTLI
jgi:hypothetical protein